MKRALVALFVFASAAQALPIGPGMPRLGEQPPIPVQKSAGNPLIEFLGQLIQPVYDNAPVDPKMEAQRLKDIEQAKATGNQAQFMTAQEIEEDMAEQGYDSVEIDGEGAVDPKLLFTPSAANGGGWLMIDVSISQQTLTMQGSETPAWAERVSTGKQGHGTVRGVFHPIRLERMWYSRKYDMSPMPYSVFFHGGFALHETPFVKNLGRKASHGCVRQNRAGAKYVFETVAYYVRTYGRTSVTITVHN